VVIGVESGHRWGNSESISVVVTMDKEGFNYLCDRVKLEWDKVKGDLGRSVACIII